MRRALLVLAVLLIASCKAEQSPTAPPLGTGTLKATVVDAATKSGVANVSIEISRGGTVVRTVTTDASGMAEISLPEGAYSVRIVPPAGYVNVAETSTEFALAAGTTASLTAMLSKT